MSSTPRRLSDSAAAGLSVALLDGEDYLLADNSMVQGVSVQPQAQSTVTVLWTPAAAGKQTVTAKVYDASNAELAAIVESHLVKELSHLTSRDPVAESVALDVYDDIQRAEIIAHVIESLTFFATHAMSLTPPFPR